MHRNVRNRSVREEVAPVHPTEAWLFAQELLGNPVPRVGPAAAEARRQRAELEWLASFSTRHEEELQRLRSAEVAARADRELLEFLADISTEHEDKLREVLWEEAELREAQERVERFHQRQRGDISHVQEAGWDASKHPRRGSAPNAGWWASTGSAGNSSGGGAGSRNSVPATAASYSGSKRVASQFAAWDPPVGHHWVPVGVVQNPEIRSLLSDEAVQYAAGAYSGPTDPHHGNTTLAETTHPKYNANVKKEVLQVF